MGNYHAADLKSEDVDIHIAGSGNADVYAESNLNIDIAGSGDVNYHGNASRNKTSPEAARSRKLINEFCV